MCVGGVGGEKMCVGDVWRWRHGGMCGGEGVGEMCVSGEEVGVEVVSEILFLSSAGAVISDPAQH